MATLNSPLHPKALRYLAAVAQLGSVQAAAREVSISASAIDRQILMLEEDMGVPLFERLPRGMRLTAAGSCCWPCRSAGRPTSTARCPTSSSCRA
jgi:molybdenum-dependent DNA-binding transcriptional regulator ModE